MKQPKAGSHVKEGSIEAMEAENPHRMTPIKKIQTKVTYRNIWKFFFDTKCYKATAEEATRYKVSRVKTKNRANSRQY